MKRFKQSFAITLCTFQLMHAATDIVLFINPELQASE